MHSVGMRPVVVHGGGPQIGDVMDRLGKVPEFRDGLRVTDAETLEIARMVLVGKVNREIVSAINVHGPLAVGLCGEDGGLIEAEVRDPGARLRRRRRRGEPADPRALLAEDLIPVVSTIGADCRRARPTTSTPTPWPAPSRPSSAPRRSSTSPMCRACCATSTIRPR